MCIRDRLVGAPPGYVGYDEGGQLTEAVRRKPYSVILFDEIEKAHPDVFNILLQLLDDGRLTDNQGRTVDFKNTIVIMTSNIGSAYLTENIRPDGSIDPAVKEQVRSELNKYFRPEFINRVDEIVYFNRLTEENFRPIARLMLDELKDSLKEKGLTFVYDEALVDDLVKKSYSAAYGARNLRRTVQKEVEDALASAIINSYDHPITHIAATAEEGKVVLRTL